MNITLRLSALGLVFLLAACGDMAAPSDTALTEVDAGERGADEARSIGSRNGPGGGPSNCATPSCGDLSCSATCDAALSACNARNGNLNEDDLMEPCGLYHAQCIARCDRRPW